jgi:ceramide glucosyltransferase
MLWRRDDLNRAGGLRALAQELAEDAAATKVVRDAGLRVRLVDGPFGQPLGQRSLRDVWKRQLRWARLRRDSFRLFYAPEIIATGVAPMLLAALAGGVVDESPLAGAALAGVIWYGGEAALAHAAGWPLSPKAVLAWVLRDVAMIPLWIIGWFGNDIVWRGNQMDLSDDVLLKTGD